MTPSFFNSSDSAFKYVVDPYARSLVIASNVIGDKCNVAMPARSKNVPTVFLAT